MYRKTLRQPPPELTCASEGPAKGKSLRLKLQLKANLCILYGWLQANMIYFNLIIYIHLASFQVRQPVIQSIRKIFTQNQTLKARRPTNRISLAVHHRAIKSPRNPVTHLPSILSYFLLVFCMRGKECVLRECVDVCLRRGA